MNRKSIFFFSIITTGFLFILSILLLYTSADLKTSIKLNSSPKAFEYKNTETNIKVHNSVSSETHNSHNYYLKTPNFKLYTEVLNGMNVLSFSNDNVSVHLMSFYEKPVYKYGLFNDLKSFWLLTTNPANKNRYSIFAYYSFNKLTPIKLYESESDENFSQLDVSFSNDIIRIDSPSNIISVSKYGQVDNK